MCAQYKFCIINCALLYGSMQNIFSAQAHCIMYIIVYLAHITYMVLVAVTPLHATWCHSQYNCALLYGSRRTQMWHILQKTSCKFYKTGHCCTSSVYNAAPCFVQQPSNTVAGQESALYFNHALPIPSVLYSIHLLHIIVLCTY